jgi:hypothetical protein
MMTEIDPFSVSDSVRHDSRIINQCVVPIKKPIKIPFFLFDLPTDKPVFLPLHLLQKVSAYN